MAESNASKLANNILTDGKFDATDVVGNITSTGIDDNATSTAITIDSSQNVGIGTASPSTKLTIDEGGEPPATGMLTLQSNSASRQLRISPPTNAENGFIDYRGGNLVFKDDGTEVARFQGSTGFEVTGTITVSDGIYIGGTAAANKLDDYEEGTWTPTLTTGTSAQDLKYTKIGNVVHIAGTISFSSVSGSGTIEIGGLPFTSTNHTDSYTSLNCHAYKSLNIPGQEFQTLRVNINSTTMNIIAPTSNGSTRTFGDHSHVTGSSFVFRVGGFYLTN
jgi:hypothetical protein